jgi:hypothetical protein
MLAARGLDAARRALELRAHWSPALKTVAVCSQAAGDEERARSALAEMRDSSDPGRDITPTIAKFNPHWAEHISQVLDGLAAPVSVSPSMTARHARA